MPKTTTDEHENTINQVSQMTFHDEDKGYRMEVLGESDPTTRHANSNIADLRTFLEKPVLLKTFNWLEGSHLQEFTDVWGDLATHPLIANKLKNYGGMRATLNIKLSISSSPFYAGLAMACYNVNPGSSISYPVVIANDQHLVLLSQRPRVLLSPQDSMGGEMKIPFIYPYNYVCLNKFYDTNAPGLVGGVGTLTVSSPTILKNFNSVATAPVTISLYAWFTDVELTMNSLNSNVQSSAQTIGFKKKGKRKTRARVMSMTQPDEYGQGAVSGIASAVASAAGALSHIPIIGPYARATQMGAGHLAGLASWFGYTNTPVIADHLPYTPKPFPNMASSEISHPTDRLALDPKNELTIDSRVCGLDGSDELAIVGLVARESYLTSFEWSAANVSGDLLWSSLVTPQLFRVDGSAMYCTPMAYVAYLFADWCGDIEFRFVVQATKFHMGRMRVEYEPLTYTNTPDAQIVNVTEVIDIAETKDFTVVVPYSQLRQWSRVVPLKLATKVEVFGTTFPSRPTDNSANGMLTVRVQNQLSGPSADNVVSVSVFVKGAPNLTFNNPVAPPNTAYFAPQSGAMECREECEMEPYSTDVRWIDEVDDVTKSSFGVYMGETLLSLRQLMHRDSYYTTFGINNEASDHKRLMLRTLNSIYPRVPGYNWPNSLHRDLAEDSFNYVAYSPMSWMMPCYGAVRGSVNWTVNPVGDLASSVVIQRSASYRDVTKSFQLIQVANTATYSRSLAALEMLTDFSDDPTGQSGMILTNQRTAAGLSANVPYYSSSRYSYPNPKTIQNNIPTHDDHEGARQNVDIRVCWHLEHSGAVADESQVDYYVSAGHDFNLCNFKNVPPIYLYADTLPAPSINL